MNAVHLDFKSVNRYVPHILVIGIAIGTANYLLHAQFNWLQWLILSCSTSFIIGYSLISFAAHKSWFQQKIQPDWILYILLALAFFVIGALASEVEQIIKNFIFLNEPYRPFAGGNIYGFNGIIALAMGLSFFRNWHFFAGQPSKVELPLEAVPDSIASEESITSIAKVPVRKGENIILVALEQIVYFEAYDNYSFLYDLDGNKMLCDYSLIFLEKRLAHNFLRIHRKYIVNANHIKQIKPHLNSRYLIEFEQSGLESISSSKTYAAAMRKLIKID
ncbi:MAG: LytTR family DNA-binding domain-containing protein [Bacteroidota bacterium]